MLTTNQQRPLQCAVCNKTTAVMRRHCHDIQTRLRTSAQRQRHCIGQIKVRIIRHRSILKPYSDQAVTSCFMVVCSVGVNKLRLSQRCTRCVEHRDNGKLISRHNSVTLNYKEQLRSCNCNKCR